MRHLAKRRRKKSDFLCVILVKPAWSRSRNIPPKAGRLQLWHCALAHLFGRTSPRTRCNAQRSAGKFSAAAFSIELSALASIAGESWMRWDSYLRLNVRNWQIALLLVNPCPHERQIESAV
jgi:hypothetical protein